MNLKELFEGTAPKLPGAFKGVQVMTPQQFLAKSGDEPDQEGVAEGSYEETEENAVINMFEKLIKQGRDPIDMIVHKFGWGSYELDQLAQNLGFKNSADWARGVMQGKGVNAVVAEGAEHLARIRKLSGLDEATKLPAQQREFGGQEFQDYMKRIVGTPDLDKEGKPKVDKKGVEKYVSGKTKADKYKMPYIHRSSVVE